MEDPWEEQTGLEPRREARYLYFLQGRAGVVPQALGMAPATLVPSGVSSSAFRRKLSRGAQKALPSL